MDGKVIVPDGTDELTVQSKIKEACRELQAELGNEEAITVISVERKW